MPRKLSSIAPDWWDYTTLDDQIIRAAASLTPELLPKLSRPGFKVVLYDTLEDLYLAEALEYFRGCEVLREAMGQPLFETVIAVRETEVEQFAAASEEEIVAATRFRY